MKVWLLLSDTRSRCHGHTWAPPTWSPLAGLPPPRVVTWWHFLRSDVCAESQRCWCSDPTGLTKTWTRSDSLHKWLMICAVTERFLAPWQPCPSTALWAHIKGFSSLTLTNTCISAGCVKSGASSVEPRQCVKLGHSFSTTCNYFNNYRETGSGNSEAESGCAVGSCPNSAPMLKIAELLCCRLFRKVDDMFAGFSFAYLLQDWNISLQVECHSEWFIALLPGL